MTEKINEPKNGDEQTTTISKKTYILSTGENVDKINETDYVITKRTVISKITPIIGKSFITDIKTLFDGLKNLAICFAILLALPTMQMMAANTYDHRFFTVGFIWAGLALTALLTTYNFIWLYSTMESKPMSKFFDKLAWCGTIATVLVIFSCATAITYPKLILSPFGSDSISNHPLLSKAPQ